MSEFKISKGPRGRNLYFKKTDKGFKMISVKDIPEDILKTMQPEKPVDDQKPEFRKCIFCGELGTEEKRINGQIIYLCLDDYNNRTTGEVVECLRQSLVSV